MELQARECEIADWIQISIYIIIMKRSYNGINTNTTIHCCECIETLLLVFVYLKAYNFIQFDRPCRRTEGLCRVITNAARPEFVYVVSINALTLFV